MILSYGIVSTASTDYNILVNINRLSINYKVMTSIVPLCLSDVNIPLQMPNKLSFGYKL